MTLTERPAQGQNGVCVRPTVPHAARMDSSAFVRIEREAPDGVRHYVVHAHDPRFTLELSPDDTAPDRRGRGVMRRLSVPNSWAGDYTRYARLVAAAQEFFAQPLDDPAPKAESRRWVR